MDDENAVPYTLSQVKDNAPHFKVGVALLSRTELDGIRKKYGADIFDYNRAPNDDNRYHGNLLLRDEGGTPFKKMISVMLAHFADVRLRNDINPCKT